MIAVLTGLGVSFAISASRSLAPGSVCLASTTITLVWPTMIVTLPPAPPSAAQTFGLSCLMVIGGGAGAWAGCCAAAVDGRVPKPARIRTGESRRNDFIDLLLLWTAHCTTQHDDQVHDCAGRGNR